LLLVVHLGYGFAIFSENHDELLPLFIGHLVKKTEQFIRSHLEIALLIGEPYLPQKIGKWDKRQQAGFQTPQHSHLLGQVRT
jgi:hypothetical protein